MGILDLSKTPLLYGYPIFIRMLKVIRDGWIVTQNEKREIVRGDVVIDGDNIVSVGGKYNGSADVEIDAKGDIVMPGMNGIELGKQLREHSADCRIFYLSSSREYAVDSYDVKAFAYLLKPTPSQQFFSVLEYQSLRLSKFIFLNHDPVRITVINKIVFNCLQFEKCGRNIDIIPFPPCADIPAEHIPLRRSGMIVHYAG